jgi:hypothetical protein|tara:strand:+ start:2934 stop:4070 length:1137 start_codon:yes stop_codon:yes gene_type:complete
MTNLNRLNVSLTKHGAHKVARLVHNLPLDQVLGSVSSDELNVHIDLGQTKKVLSIYNGSEIPKFWAFAKKQGPETINALTLISFIFAHHELISSFAGTTDPTHKGRIKREKLSNGKAFTNLSNNTLELGYSTHQETEYFEYDFTGFFKLHGLGSFVSEMLSIRLKEAGWEQTNTLADEAIANGFHRVFGLSEDQFCEWLTSGTLSDEAGDLSEIDDIPFLSSDDSPGTPSPFVFQAGHSPRKEGEITASSRDSAYTTKLLHNEIQTSLYEELKRLYGDNCVGTEIPTGDGTSIDLVVKTDDFCWFYEIKTASTAKLCIRQAIPQLLEYAYWQGDISRADKLVIVSQNESSPQSEAYLKLLREHFKLNLHYEQHTPKPN